MQSEMQRTIRRVRVARFTATMRREMPSVADEETRTMLFEAARFLNEMALVLLRKLFYRGSEMSENLRRCFLVDLTMRCDATNGRAVSKTLW